jgi:hypothetical protein
MSVLLLCYSIVTKSSEFFDLWGRRTLPEQEAWIQGFVYIESGK